MQQLIKIYIFSRENFHARPTNTARPTNRSSIPDAQSNIIADDFRKERRRKALELLTLFS